MLRCLPDAPKDSGQSVTQSAPGAWGSPPGLAPSSSEYAPGSASGFTAYWGRSASGSSTVTRKATRSDACKPMQCKVQRRANARD